MEIPKLTETQKQQLRLQIEAEILRRSLYDFFVASSKILYPQVEWDYPPFYKYICDLLQAEVLRLERREEKKHDYIFNLPFRAGKSILLSQIFPVWCWIRDSSISLMQISHSEALATKHSHASKMLIESEWFKARFPDIELRMDTHAKSNYMTNTGGKRTSFGVNSGIIGEGCNIMIVDDINNPADSQAVTNSINEVFTDTLYSRLNNPKIDFRIILQQRVNTFDICGYLLSSNPHKYRHICLPVRIANNINPPELIELYSNGLLWGNRFTEKVILDFQQTLGSRAFSSQLMQTPQIEEGGIFKRAWVQSISLDNFNKLIDRKTHIEWNLYIDTAYTSKQENDASAAVLACKHNNNVYILKAWKWWKDFPDLVKVLEETIRQYGVRITYIESKASGLSVKQYLQRNGFNCADLHPHKVNQFDSDKVSRANSITPKIEGGHLFIIEDNWNEMLLQELTNFPWGHDDLVDCVIYCIHNLLGRQDINYAMV